MSLGTFSLASSCGWLSRSTGGGGNSKGFWLTCSPMKGSKGPSRASGPLLDGRAIFPAPFTLRDSVDSLENPVFSEMLEGRSRCPQSLSKLKRVLKPINDLTEYIYIESPIRVDDNAYCWNRFESRTLLRSTIIIVLTRPIGDPFSKTGCARCFFVVSLENLI